MTPKPSACTGSWNCGGIQIQAPPFRAGSLTTRRSSIASLSAPYPTCDILPGLKPRPTSASANTPGLVARHVPPLRWRRPASATKTAGLDRPSCRRALPCRPALAAWGHGVRTIPRTQPRPWSLHAPHRASRGVRPHPCSASDPPDGPSGVVSFRARCGSHPNRPAALIRPGLAHQCRGRGHPTQHALGQAILPRRPRQRSGWAGVSPMAWGQAGGSLEGPELTAI